METLGEAYVGNKNTSARLCAKNAGELMHEGRGGGIFVGHYSTVEYNCSLLYYQLIFDRLVECMTGHFLQVYSNQTFN